MGWKGERGGRRLQKSCLPGEVLEMLITFFLHPAASSCKSWISSKISGKGPNLAWQQRTAVSQTAGQAGQFCSMASFVSTTQSHDLHLDVPIFFDACFWNPTISVKDPRGSNKLRLDLARS